MKHGQCFWATASNFSGPHPSARLAGCADLVRRAFRTARSRRSRDCCLNHVRGLCCGHPSAGASGLAGETCLRSATFRFPALSRPASASMSLMLLLNPVRVSMPTLHSKAQLLQQRSHCPPEKLLWAARRAGRAQPVFPLPSLIRSVRWYSRRGRWESILRPGSHTTTILQQM